MKTNSQVRQFKVHPATILSLIGEQAGDPVKALTELIMNCIDAGAKNILLTLTSHSFTLIDDGVGFSSLEQIENNFGKFGMPHEKGDSIYGSFRMGRGQIFKIANTKWESSNFIMKVDINGKAEDLKYYLEEQSKYIDGCTITGYFYDPLNVHEEIRTPELFNNLLENGLINTRITTENAEKILSSESFVDRLLKFLFLIEGVNITINGHSIKNEFSTNPLYEDENFKLHMVKNISKTYSFNKGVYVEDDYDFPQMIVNYKKSPDLNMARNQINHNCSLKKESIKIKTRFWFDSLINGHKWAKDICKSKLQDYLASDNRSNFKKVVNGFLNHDNLIKFLNLIEIDLYKAGKIKKIGLIDFLDDFQDNSEKYLISDYKQNRKYIHTNKKDLIGFLKTTGVIKGVVFIPFYTDFETIFLKANQILNIYEHKSYTGTLQKHGLFNEETEIKSVSKDSLKTNSKASLDTSRDKFLKELSDKIGFEISDYKQSILEKVISTENIVNLFIQDISQYLKETFENEEIDSVGDIILFSQKKIKIRIIPDQHYQASRKIRRLYFSEKELFIIVKEPKSAIHIIDLVISSLLDSEGLTGWNYIESPDDIEYIRDVLNDKFIYKDEKRNHYLNHIYKELSSNPYLENMRLKYINLVNRELFVGRIRPDQTKRNEKSQLVNLLESMPDEFKSKFKNFDKVKQISL